MLRSFVAPRVSPRVSPRISRRTSHRILAAGLLGLGLVAVAACGHGGDDAASGEDAITATPDAMLRTLNDLASFGEKRVGTPEGQRAAEYVAQRMRTAGLANVHFEEFNFPMHIADLPGSSFRVMQNGQPLPPIAFDVFEGSGNGRGEGEVVFVGSAKPEDLRGKDLHGKIAFVARDEQFHRSSQYRNVAAAGAAAMLYQSLVPKNQIQIGSIREKWEAMGPIPTITIGQDDGDKLRCVLGAGKSKQEQGNGSAGSSCNFKQGSLTAAIEVKARNAHGTGRNVVGVVPGRNFGQKDPQGRSLDHQVVVGAHYDTWYVGSADNGCGVAGMLGMVDLRARPATPPEHSIVFVAFDGEEVGLYGGYDYLRKHKDEGLLSIINLEIPAAETDLITGGFETLVSGVATSETPVIENAMRDAQLTGPFTAFAVELSLDRIARMFGGIIPTDIQGWYRAGVPTIATASSTPWYHTRMDTPDKVDTKALVRVINAMSRTVDRLLASPVDSFRPIDARLWDGTLEIIPQDAKKTTALVRATLKDGKGQPLRRTNVTATLFCDDFFAAPDAIVPTDDNGVMQFTLAELNRCGGRRWVHITAGPEYPLVEKVVAVP